MACMTSMESLVMQMKVSHLLAALEGMNPQDDIAVKYYEKWEYEDSLEEDLSDKSWEIVCEEYEQNETIEQMSKSFLDEKCWEKQKDEPCMNCHQMSCVCDNHDGIDFS